MRRHLPFYIATAASLAVGGVCAFLIPRLAVVIAANVFFAIYLCLSVASVGKLTPGFLRRHDASSDEPVWAIFTVTFAAVVVAVVSLFAVINGSEQPRAVAMSLALLSVALGWMTIHMMAAIHYAHLYWSAARHSKPPKDGHRAIRRGLDFPGDAEPGGADFVYFAYVVGMTAQTSDVAITTAAMRKVNLVHAVVSFFFNTVLVAAAVNVAVSLGT